MGESHDPKQIIQPVATHSIKRFPEYVLKQQHLKKELNSSSRFRNQRISRNYNLTTINDLSAKKNKKMIDVILPEFPDYISENLIPNISYGLVPKNSVSNISSYKSIPVYDEDGKQIDNEESDTLGSQTDESFIDL